jgi:hypothetical protein
MNAQLKPQLADSQLARNARDYLDRHTGNLPAIAAATGVDYQWLRAFKCGRIADPGVSRVEAILRHGGLLPSTDRRAGGQP